MARMTNQMKMLEDRLEQVRREIEKLKSNEAMLVDMLREASGEPKPRLRVPRSNVKQTVLSLLEEVADQGLNATTAVELAAKDGVSLERGTVSSLLSRLKSEDIVEYDGAVYRLKQLSGGTTLNVHPLRTSGVGR